MPQDPSLLRVDLSEQGGPPSGVESGKGRERGEEGWQDQNAMDGSVSRMTQPPDIHTYQRDPISRPVRIPHLYPHGREGFFRRKTCPDNIENSCLYKI